MTRISYVIPTRDRAQQLAHTLAALGNLPAHDAEVVVVDDASDVAIGAPRRLANGSPVEIIRRDSSIGAAARNEGVNAARGAWIVMLDDDSFPLDLGFIDVIAEAPRDIVAIGAEIFLSEGGREWGGLPEVFIGCGAAIRREAFLAAGGYDPSFHYYVEESDLAARLIARGGRIVHDRRFRVMHEKVSVGRNLNRILERLVRNGAWVVQRYAPDERRDREFERVFRRYLNVAHKEGALDGYRRGHTALESTLDAQPRTPLTEEQWLRFTGERAARDTLGGLDATAEIVDPGKGATVVRDVLGERVVEAGGDVLVVGTLSPGRMLDAIDRHTGSTRPILAPWHLTDSLAAC